jgi:hypothetical protein
LRDLTLVTLQPGQILPSPLAPVSSLTSLHGKNAAGTKLPRLSIDAAARLEPGQVVSPKKYIKVEAPDDSFALANSSPHSSPSRSRRVPLRGSSPNSLPSRSRLVPLRDSSPPLLHRRNYPSSTQPYVKASKINNLSRELRKTRECISIAKERERRLQKEIEKLTGSEMSKPEENETLQERSKSIIFFT